MELTEIKTALSKLDNVTKLKINLLRAVEQKEIYQAQIESAQNHVARLDEQIEQLTKKLQIN